MGKDTRTTVQLIYKGLSASGKAANFWAEEPQGDDRPVWVNLPLSQISLECDRQPHEIPVGSVVEVTMPLWLAHADGLV